MSQHQMPIYFANREPIDLAAIEIMGVSVKKGENPIGFFGTGLKFAIATLLRLGCKVTLLRDNEAIEFTTITETIRGEKFKRVCMGATRMGFTTNLGRTWEAWQAYRELHCNATDEGGVISDTMPAGQWGTVFVVDGDPIVKAHNERHEIFLLSPPISTGPIANIHPRIGILSQHAFYRGVRAHKLGALALFTYNIIKTMELTEDRTIKHSYWMNDAIVDAILSLEDEQLIEDILLAPEGTFESSISFDTSTVPGEAFMRVAPRLRSNQLCNPSALKMWRTHAKLGDEIAEVALDAYEEELLEKAFVLLRRLRCDIERHDFSVVVGLGATIYGTARGGRIKIAKACFDHGHLFVASTLYEEWLHLNQQMDDESRALQNLLFEKLLAMVERVVALEARGDPIPEAPIQPRPAGHAANADDEVPF